MPVVEAFREHDKVININAMKDVDTVYADVRAAMEKVFSRLDSQ